MKKPLGLLVLAGFLSTACAKEEPPVDQDATVKQADPVKVSYVEKTKQDVDQWSQKVIALESKSKARGSKARQDVDVYVHKARQNISDAKRGLQELHSTKETAWGPLQRGIEEAVANIKKNFESAKAAFERPATLETPKEKS